MRILEREEFTVYHVVPEHPMKQGQMLHLDETWKSGVCRRVTEKMPLVERIYQDPTSWDGKELEHHTMVALREHALEQVRREQFPQYPSRLHCLYVSQRLEEARQWAAFFVSLGRPTFHIVKLQVHGRRFVGNANMCFTATADREQNLKLAKRYWQVVPDCSGEAPIWEILADGDVLVEKLVENIGENLEVDCR